MIEHRMRRDLTAAMKARDAARVRVLRSMLAALANAEAPSAPDGPAWPPVAAGTTEVARIDLSEADRIRILRDEVAQREDAVAALAGQDRPVEAQALRDEVAIIAAYLE